MTVSITRKFEWDAAHRVLGHEGKCRHIHGHRYVAEVTVEAPELDSLGRVIDFGQIKDKIGGWINKWWDHNILLHPDDPLLEAAIALEADYPTIGIFQGRAPYVMIDMDGKNNVNPTAENIARLLAHYSKHLLRELSFEGEVTHVRVFETPNCWADYTPSR